MKALILTLLMLVTLSADKILISGLSYHSEAKNVDGTKVNPYNYGLGYQKAYKHFGFDTTITTLILKDSFSHPMFSMTYGINHKMDYNGFKFNIGMEFGVGYKKVLYGTVVNGNTDNLKYGYYITPIAFVPTASIQKGAWSLEALHIPKLDSGGLHIMSATLLLIGYKI